uniref:Uncharacterized protein n=1 Tax=Anguilla anguilla TaxID=7936 RepID=A0A0E9WCD7_ANGAN
MPHLSCALSFRYVSIAISLHVQRPGREIHWETQIRKRKKKSSGILSLSTRVTSQTL